MATSAGDLLDHLARLTEVSAAGRQTSIGAADAARAVGHLAGGMHELRRVGVSPRAGDERDQLVRHFVQTCQLMANHSPARESPLSLTAAAAADATAIAGRQTSTPGRWALTTELLDASFALGELVAIAPVGAEIRAVWAEARVAAVALQHDAALQPPLPRHFEALDRPVPAVTATASHNLPEVVREAAARLYHHSEQQDSGLTIAQVLARTMAAETLVRSVQARGYLDPTPPGHVDAADAWRTVRAALRPFNDGSRHPQQVADAGTAASLRLHRALVRAGDPAFWPPPMRAAAAASLQLVPVHARQLERTLYRWVDDGTLTAYACDLDYRDGRAGAYLAGHSQAGLIRVAAAEDVHAAAGAMQRAGLLTSQLAAAAADHDQLGSPFPRHIAASHKTAISQTNAGELGAAARRAFEQLERSSATPTPSHRR